MFIPEDYTAIDSFSQFREIYLANEGKEKIEFLENDLNTTKSEDTFYSDVESVCNLENDSEVDHNPFAIKQNYEDIRQKAETFILQPSLTTNKPFSNHQNDSLPYSSSQQSFKTQIDRSNNPFLNVKDDPDAEQKSVIIEGFERVPPVWQESEKELNFIKIQRDLERRIKELEEREASLPKITSKFTQSTQYPEAKNWPPLPNWTHLTPCFYQSIPDDIPKLYQDVVKKTYYSWLLYVLLLTCNVFVGLTYLFVRLGNKNKTNDGKAMGLAILYCIIFIPTSYTCWFRVIYRACKNDSTLCFMTFFIASFFQCLSCIIFSFGIDSSGFFGLINGIAQFTCDVCTGKNFFVGTCMIALGIAFACCGGLQCYVTVKINKLYTKKEQKVKEKHKIKG